VARIDTRALLWYMSKPRPTNDLFERAPESESSSLPI
jgi:hypothetical protein